MFGEGFMPRTLPYPKIPEGIYYNIDLDVYRYEVNNALYLSSRDIWNLIWYGPDWHMVDDGDTIIRGEN